MQGHKWESKLKVHKHEKQCLAETERSIKIYLEEENGYRHFLLNSHRPFLQMGLCVCQAGNMSKHTHTSKREEKYLSSCSEPLWSVQLPGNCIIATMGPTFRKAASLPSSFLFLLVSHKHAPANTSCCPLTSHQPCSGPGTQKPAAWCQTEWVSQGLSGPPVPEQPPSSGTHHWLKVYFLALLYRNQAEWRWMTTTFWTS